MSGITRGPAASASPAVPAGPEARLRKAAHDLEGVFVNELFKAMRQAVPEGGLLESDPGRDLFTGLLDERLAEVYAEGNHRGLGESLYRQLSRRLLDGKPAQGAS